MSIRKKKKVYKLTQFMSNGFIEINVQLHGGLQCIIIINIT